eukprot:c17782_g1_i1 orf=74-2626(-)
MAHNIVLSYASSFLFALLISSADFSSQIAATTFVEDDCQQGDCSYGVDMFPEKSFDQKSVEYVRKVDSRAKVPANSAEPAEAGSSRVETGNRDLDHSYAHAGMADSKHDGNSENSEMANRMSCCAELMDPEADCSMDCDAKVHPDENNAQFSLEQMKLLVAKQQNQLEYLEHLSIKLQHIMDKLENRVLHPSDCVNGEHEGSSLPTFKVSSEGKDVSGTHLSSPTSLRDDITTEGREGHVQLTKATEKIPEGLSLPEEVMHVRTKPGHDSRHAYSGGMTIARYKPAWSEHFQFLSAVKVDGDVTCLHVLPHEGEEGLSKYVAVGVDIGRVYIFLSHGDLLVDFQTASHFPVTAILSFTLRKNETMFLTGHSDGTVLVHKLWETKHSGPSLGDDWHTLCMEHIQALAAPGSHDPVAIAATSVNKESDAAVKRGTLENTVKILEVYRVGKMRYILASDSEGNIQVFRDNGTFYGAAKAPSQPLAFLRSPNSQRLLFLTQGGVASLDLRSLSVRSGPCEGLNGTRVIAYTFDATGRSKAYGFTDEGNMIYVALSGDTLHFECHVRSTRKLEVGTSVGAQGIKGYLLVATPTQVLVYNTTLPVGYTYSSIPVGGPRLLFAASIDEISLSFLSGSIESSKQPVIACNRERLVVLGFGDGYVGMYKSNLLVQKPGNFNSRAWNSPLIIIVLMLLGGWHFFGKKKDASVATNDGEISSSVTIPGYVRTAMDEPREALMDSRRYSSPSKAFPGSAGGVYNTGALKYRNSVAEQSFRTSGETPFRGSLSIEPSLRSSSLEPHAYLNREAVESKFRATNLDSAFQSPIAESLKRELDLKASRGSPSLQPRMKSLQEPNSF